VREVLKPEVVGSMLIDSMKEEGNEEVTDVATSWDLELTAPALLEYLEDDTDEVLLGCDMGRLEEVEVTIRLEDTEVVAGAGFADPGVDTEILVEKAVADCVVHVAPSLGG
jgi:hypothetical protein